MQAVILAAGLGSRIREYHNSPKGFISIGSEPIIVESINALKQYGINDILIVTGYRAQYYENLAKKTPGVNTVFNPNYDSSGSVYSLYCAKDWIKEDCLILESDLIYDMRAIDVIMNASKTTTILLSGITYSGDEIYVEANNQILINMSKQIETLNASQIYGEFVGINKISLSNYRQLVNILKNDATLLNFGHYEEGGLVALARQRPVYCLKIPDLLWCEIDNLSHFQRATKLHKTIQTAHKVINRTILLNPGPLTTTESVKNALVVSDICHRESEFTDLLRGIRHDLLPIVNAGDDYTSIIFTASGSGAIEACISSVVPANKKLAVINNGAYGQRMINIAKRYNIDVFELKFEFDKPIVFETVEAALNADANIHAVAMVHHETSSGVLNPLRHIGELCHRLGRRFIVDATSSFAGTEINVYKDHIDFIMASSNKCLHGMPGLAFVLCNKHALLETEGNARSYYLDLHQQYHALEKSGQMPFTPAVQVAYSLRQALNEFFVETLEGRIQRYHENYDCMITGLKTLGFDIITPKLRQSKLIAMVRFPENDFHYEFDTLHDFLYEKGYTIYPKKLPIDNTFRLACIGHLDTVDIRYFLSELENYMQSVTNKYEDLV